MANESNGWRPGTETKGELRLKLAAASSAALDHEEEIIDLRKQIADCKSAYGKLFNANAALEGECDGLRAEVATLNDRLANYTRTLTDDEISMIHDETRCNGVRLHDAAIRRLRAK